MAYRSIRTLTRDTRRSSATLGGEARAVARRRAVAAVDFGGLPVGLLLLLLMLEMKDKLVARSELQAGRVVQQPCCPRRRRRSRANCPNRRSAEASSSPQPGPGRERQPGSPALRSGDSRLHGDADPQDRGRACRTGNRTPGPGRPQPHQHQADRCLNGEDDQPVPALPQHPLRVPAAARRSTKAVSGLQTW
jgi:hypothetical protein